MHEHGHLIGFYHEHQRPDRDRYIRVLTNNIPPPIELDGKGSDDDSRDSIVLILNDSTPQTLALQTMATLDKMKARIHYEAKNNIALAQLRYKKDYDKKFCKEKVIHS